MLSIIDSQNALEQLIRVFFRGSLEIKLEDDDIKEFTWGKQDEFLKATVNSALFKKYPVRSEFTKLFFKKLIERLEVEQDVHDDMYNCLCTTMNSVNNTCSYRHYIIGNDLSNSIIIRETNHIVVNGTTGMRTWEAALLLADWALFNKDVFRNKNVLELGSGVGFTGITISKFCQSGQVVLSDCHCDVLNTIEENLNINFLDLQRQATTHAIMFRNDKISIGVKNFDWTEIPDLSLEMCPDIIIGADIIYDPMILQPLCNVFQAYLNINKNIQIYLAGVIRNEETFDMFLRKTEAMNLQYEKVEHERNIFIEWNHNIKIYLIKIYLYYLFYYFSTECI